MRMTRAVYVTLERTLGAGGRAGALVLAALLLAPLQAWGQAGGTLDNISYAQLPGNRVQVQLTLSQAVSA